jgi:hypothetical protein
MKRHKSHFPLAVYEATFADGSKARLSFGRRRKDGSPDADSGRAMVALLWCRPSDKAPPPYETKTVDAEAAKAKREAMYRVKYGRRDDRTKAALAAAEAMEVPEYAYTVVPALNPIYHLAKPPIVDGVIEFKGERSRDPRFAEGETVSGSVPVLPSRRITAKQALRDLLAALSNPALSPDELRAVYEQARRIAA